MKPPSGKNRIRSSGERRKKAKRISKRSYRRNDTHTHTHTHREREREREQNGGFVGQQPNAGDIGR